MPGRVFARPKGSKNYWIAFYCKGTEYRTSAKTTKKRTAEALLAFYLGQVARGEFRGFAREAPALSLSEGLDDFEENCQERGLAAFDRIHSHLNAVWAYFKNVAAADVDERRIDLYRKHRLKAGRKRTTINRETQYLSQALKFVVKKKLLSSAPAIEKYPEHNARQGFFDVDDFERVVALLPPDLQDFVRFGYYSGWRRGEITQLAWRDVETEVLRLRPEVCKNRDGRLLALVGEIAAIIERRRAVQRPDVPWVFYRLRRGKYWPVLRFDKVWRKAWARAGVTGRIFHDFRRSTVRNMTRAGVPEKSPWTPRDIKRERSLTAIISPTRRISGPDNSAHRPIWLAAAHPLFPCNTDIIRTHKKTGRAPAL